MDIFKILSRSTKLLNRSTSNIDASQLKLPSAGSSANPQLYHDAIPDSRGKKRKRETKNPALERMQDEDFELNFFALNSAIPQAQRSTSASAGDTTATESAPQLLDVDERRKILRSHRLKLTVLLSGESTKTKSKRSSQKKFSTQVSKERYKQIYPQTLVAISDLRSIYGISNRLAENLAAQGYKIPTEVQMASLPLLLRPELAMGDDMELGDSGVNLLTVAPTGSGKTLAFLIPVVDKIIQRRRRKECKNGHCLEAIVLAPTKELASQIVDEGKKLSLGTGVRVVGMRKGMRLVGDDTDVGEAASDNEEDDIGDQQKRYSQPITKSDILITTPGLLLTSITIAPETYRPLPTVRNLILDEADVLLDPLFRAQTLSIWSSLTHASLCTTLWSATISSSIEALAMQTLLQNCISLPKPLIRLVVGLKDSALPSITHTLTYCATEPGKLLALRNILHTSNNLPASLRPPFIVFTQTIPRATALHAELLYDMPPTAGGPSRIAVLHSCLPDPVRSSIMARFRAGEIWVLITTDLLSRGVDFRGVNGVVNYDIPNSGADYVHRVGRTGRAGREGGIAVTFYTKEDIPYVRAVVDVIRASEKAAGKQTEGLIGKEWLLDLLPKMGKVEKKRLKTHGVEARQRHDLGDGMKDRKSARIGTKSGYERKLENRKRGAIQGSKRRAEEMGAVNDGEGSDISEP